MGLSREDAWLGGLITLVYIPSLAIAFGIHNDYWPMTYGSCCHPEGWQLLAVGRPLQAVLANVQLNWVSRVGDFQLLRAIGLLVTIFDGLLFAHILHRQIKVPLNESVFISLAVFTLPGAVLSTIYVSTMLAIGMTVGIALIAAHQLFKVEGFVLRRELLYGGATVFCAMLVYPPNALFVLVPWAAGLIFWTPEQVRGRASQFCVHIGVILAVAATYVGFIRFLWHPFLDRLDVGLALRLGAPVSSLPLSKRVLGADTTS